MSSKHMLEDVPSTEALVAMTTAAALGSLSAAATELGITHGAVSRRIAGLEGWLGQPVFERHGRGVRLTIAGEMFARRVERSLGSIAALASDLRTGGHTGIVRLSVLPSIARLWVLPHLGELLGSPADLTVSLVAEHRLASIDRRDSDLAIRSGSGSWSGVQAHLLFAETIYPLAAPLLARRAAEGGTSGLPGGALIHDTDTAGWRRWLREAGIPYRPHPGELRFDDYDLALAAAAQGLGIVLARSPLSDRHEAAGDLVRLPGPAHASISGLYVVLRHGETRSAVLRLFDRLRSVASDADRRP